MKQSLQSSSAKNPLLFMLKIQPNVQARYSTYFEVFYLSNVVSIMLAVKC